MFCGGTGFSVGQSAQVGASISQVLDSTTHSFALGGLSFNSATAVIAPDGRLESSFANVVRVSQTVSASPAGRRVLPRSVADVMRLMQ